MNHFLTAHEIAETAKRYGLSCLPHSKRSINRWAKKHGWDENSDLCRRRSGVGGGIEYHISLLPDVFQAALEGEVSKSVAIRKTDEQRQVEVVKREALDTTALTARQRQVMNARSQVLSAIENVQVAEGMSRTQAVKLFVASEVNFGLDAQAIRTANDRSNKSSVISRATILRWFQYRDGTGIGALAPKATKERSDMPPWFWDFLKHYARPQKPCITEALDAYLRTPHGVNEPITYTKVRRLIAKLGNVEKHRGREGRVSDLLCMSKLAHASLTKEHDNDDDFQGRFRRAADRR